MPKATRVYDGVEGRLEKRLSNNWMAIGSYTWARDAVTTGLSSSDENGRDNPNNSRDYDYPAMIFDQNAAVLDGVFDTDHAPDQGVGAVSLQVGHVVRRESTRVQRHADHAAGADHRPRQLPDSLSGRASDGRTPFLTRRPICWCSTGSRWAAAARQLQANILNLFNQRTVNNKVSTMRRTGAIPLGPGFYTEAEFYAGTLNFDDLIAKSVAAGRMTLTRSSCWPTAIRRRSRCASA